MVINQSCVTPQKSEGLALHRGGSLKSRLIRVVITYVSNCPRRVFEVKAYCVRFSFDALVKQRHDSCILLFTRAIEPCSFHGSV